MFKKFSLLVALATLPFPTSATTTEYDVVLGYAAVCRSALKKQLSGEVDDATPVVKAWADDNDLDASDKVKLFSICVAYNTGYLDALKMVQAALK